MNLSRCILTIAAIGVLSGCSRSSNQAPPPDLFHHPSHYSVGQGPTYLIASDVNQDMALDLITCNLGSDDLSVLLGNGDGTFQDQILTKISAHPTQLVAGNFNGDAFPDLAIMHGISTLLTIMGGNGDGTFFEIRRVDLEKTPTAIITDDFTGDGHLDLAISFRLDEVRIFRGNGRGLFIRSHDFDPGDTPTGMTTTDLNNDGRRDLIIANNGIMKRGIAFFHGKGNGTFTKLKDLKTTLVPLLVRNADFTEDGILDLVVVYGERNTLGLFRGNSDGSYEDPIHFGAEGGPVGITMGDYNLDGHLDLAIPNNLTHNLSILLGKGDGTFQQPPINYLTGKVPLAVTNLEFIGGEQIALAVVNNGNDSVSVLMPKDLKPRSADPSGNFQSPQAAER